MRVPNTGISIFWMRRDLRLTDNTALFHALNSDFPVLIIFIFDTNILSELHDKKDKRVNFIYDRLQIINKQLAKYRSSIFAFHGTPITCFEALVSNYPIREVYCNHDYEPYAIDRDNKISAFLKEKNIQFHSYKDQVIFEKNEVMKKDGTPYHIFTPYSRIWKQKLATLAMNSSPSEKYLKNLLETDLSHFPSLNDIEFEKTNPNVPALQIDENTLRNYERTHNFPALNSTSNAGVHLRFGTVSIRKLVPLAMQWSEKYLGELIWREFFMMILYHYPTITDQSFKKEYDNIRWRNNEEEFSLWCKGETGFPLVDAGMRQLRETGWMHNRVRMITASFLTKDLLIDWRWGEAWFAEKLLDYELSSNNGNWQWAAGSGCDAAPYFRIFNPDTQIKKFDPDLTYIKKWIPGFRPGYLPEMTNHSFARDRALKAYKKGLQAK